MQIFVENDNDNMQCHRGFDPIELCHYEILVDFETKLSCLFAKRSMSPSLYWIAQSMEATSQFREISCECHRNWVSKAGTGSQAAVGRERREEGGHS